MKTRSNSDALALLLLVLAGPRLEAATYDLNADWSDGANPNGPWAYREGSNLLGHVSAWQSGDFSSAQPAWARAGAGPTIIPAWFKSSGAVHISHDWQDGDIVIHTTDDANGVGSGPGNVTWTSPLAGWIAVSGGVWTGRDIGRANHWTLSKNGVVLTSGDVFSGDAYSRANPFYFANGSGGPSALTNVPVQVGDTLRLQFDKTSLYGDYVGVNLTIVAAVAPVLAIARASNDTIVVSWPAFWTNWMLQQNTNGIATVNWSNIPAPILDDGATRTLIVDPPTGNRFYRLFRP